MLDGKTEALMFKIQSLIKGNGYEIVEEGELIAGFDKESLQNTLTYLKERAYVDLRYAEDGVYCLALLPAGRLYLERAVKARVEEKRQTVHAVLFPVLGGFLGSFLGALLAFFVFSFAGGA